MKWSKIAEKYFHDLFLITSRVAPRVASWVDSGMRNGLPIRRELYPSAHPLL